MARRFYLSIVYDVNGYDRQDLTSRDSLKELDEIVSNYRDRNEVIAAYNGEYNTDKKKGRVCIVYEDTEVKEREIKLYGPPENYPKEERDKLFTYAHLIPVMYSDRRLMNLEACILKLKHQLFIPEVIEAIMLNLKTKKGQIIRINKKYIFETGYEKDLIERFADRKEALGAFYQRLKKASPEEQYFYCRVLMDICDLSIKKEKKVKNLKVKRKIKDIDKEYALTPTEQLERETIDMDEFYLHHDLDEVVRLSPNENRPIGSERKKKK